MNEHLIEQLKELAAHLPEERVEQLVAVLISAIETHEADQTWKKAVETGRIWRKAVIQSGELAGLTLDEALEFAEDVYESSWYRDLSDRYREDYEDAFNLWQRIGHEAGIQPRLGLPSLDNLPQIFAATGEYGPFDWRVSIDGAGVIEVEKRGQRARTAGFAETFAAIGSNPILSQWAKSLQAEARQSLGFSWLGNIERAMDDQFRRGAPPYMNTGTLRPSIRFSPSAPDGGWLNYSAGDLRKEDLDQFRGIYDGDFISDAAHATSALSGVLDNLKEEKDIYHHKPIVVGDEAQPLPMEAVQPPKMFRGVYTQQIRSGTAYLNRKGKIIFIDYD